MTKTVAEPVHFALLLSLPSRRIDAVVVRENFSDGEYHLAEPVEEKNDVTSDFHYILLALADMLDDSKTQGSFTFTTQGGDDYEVTIKAKA